MNGDVVSLKTDVEIDFEKCGRTDTEDGRMKRTRRVLVHYVCVRFYLSFLYIMFICCVFYLFSFVCVLR